MLGKISSQQLLAAIHQLQNGSMSEHEEDELIAKLEASISDPNLSDYIFYSSLSPAFKFGIPIPLVIFYNS